MLDVFIINYAVFFFCTWLGYKCGTNIYNKNNNKVLAWIVGLFVWILSMLPFAFFVPALPN
jgi:hypothetical protein